MNAPATAARAGGEFLVFLLIKAREGGWVRWGVFAGYRFEQRDDMAVLGLDAGAPATAVRACGECDAVGLEGWQGQEGVTAAAAAGCWPDCAGA